MPNNSQHLHKPNGQLNGRISMGGRVAPTISRTPTDIGCTTDPLVYRPIVKVPEDTLISAERSQKLQKMHTRIFSGPAKEDADSFDLERSIMVRYREATQNIMKEYDEREKTIGDEHVFDMQSLYEEYGVPSKSIPNQEREKIIQKILSQHMKVISEDLKEIQESAETARLAIKIWRDENLAPINALRDERLALEVRPLIVESVEGLQAGDYVRTVFYKDASKASKNIFRGTLASSQPGTLYLTDEVVVLNGKANDLLALPVELIEFAQIPWFADRDSFYGQRIG